VKYHYTLHHQTVAYRGFFSFDRYTVSYEKFSGGYIQQVQRECSCKGDIVAVLPYDPVHKTFLMVEQFRIGMMVRDEHPWNLEIVAGFMDVEGESAIDAAKRELTEETGCQSKQIFPLCQFYPGPGSSASKTYLYLAIVDIEQAKSFTGIALEGEDIRVHRLPLAEIRNQFEKQKINNATSLIAFQHFLLNQWDKKIHS